jgi:hypothetical protein
MPTKARADVMVPGVGLHGEAFDIGANTVAVAEQSFL